MSRLELAESGAVVLIVHDVPLEHAATQSSESASFSMTIYQRRSQPSEKLPGMQLWKASHAGSLVLKAVPARFDLIYSGSGPGDAKRSYLVTFQLV